MNAGTRSNGRQLLRPLIWPACMIAVVAPSTPVLWGQPHERAAHAHTQALISSIYASSPGAPPPAPGVAAAPGSLRRPAPPFCLRPHPHGPGAGAPSKASGASSPRAAPCQGACARPAPARASARLPCPNRPHFACVRARPPLRGARPSFQAAHAALRTALVPRQPQRLLGAEEHSQPTSVRAIRLRTTCPPAPAPGAAPAGPSRLQPAKGRASRHRRASIHPPPVGRACLVTDRAAPALSLRGPGCRRARC